MNDEQIEARDNAANPPFDPITAGWVRCPDCYGVSWRLSWVHCATCQDEGIVVGPPEDGVRIAKFLKDSFAHRASNPYVGSHIREAINHANAFTGENRP